MQTLTCERGLAAEWTITLRDEQGDALTSTYAGTETLSGSVWRGDEEASSLTVTPTWATAADGTITLSLTSANTTSLAVGTYTVRLTIVDGGSTYECFRAWLEVQPSPGTGTAGTTYCSLEDMRHVAGDLVDNLMARSDQAAFAEQREAAANWTRRTIRARALALGERHYEQHAPVVEQDAIEINDGLDDGPDWGPSLYPNTTIREHVDTVIAWVDAGYLMQDAEDDEPLRRANACYAVAEVYRRQSGEQGGVPFRMRAAMLYAEAIRVLGAFTFRFDLDADGEIDRELAPL